MKKKVAFGCLLLALVFCFSACKHESQEEGKGEVKTEEKKKEKTPQQKALEEKAQKSYAMILKWGEEYFNSNKLGKNGKSCSSCHEAGKGLEGKLATYPKYSESAGKVIQAGHAVNKCLMSALKGKKELSFDSTKMISLLTYLSTLKGDIKDISDPQAKAALEKAVKLGEAYFNDKNAGTNGRTCSDCHQDGEKLHGKSATYPKYVTMADRVVLLGHMVNYCGYGPLKSKKDILLASDEMTNILAYIATFK